MYGGHDERTSQSIRDGFRRQLQIIYITPLLTMYCLILEIKTSKGGEQRCLVIRGDHIEQKNFLIR